ncbi:MAG TPA: PilT/PilU family type 4a pilus ATPase [Thermoanaerobaculia bacterium]|nr:PilT/PilU family type 4a pilus ATPase [Thermoanaerobaculia bacterium]
MALFSSETKESLKKLANKEFGTAEERDGLLAHLATADDLRARDVAWMLFRPDRAFRESGAKLLQRLRDPETLVVFVAETKGKPDAAFRAAVAILFTLNIPGVEVELPKLLAAPAKETKETKELQELARRVLIEAPVTRGTEPLLWQYALSGPADQRVLFLGKVAQGELDERGVVRWQKLALDPEPLVREKALEVLATRAPMSSIALFVQQLPLAGYSVQQLLIDALTKAAATQSPEFADQLLPLVASGDAATRTAVMKILLGMKDPAAVVKRYIRFTKTLAGFVRDRALESIRVFGNQLIEPTIELLGDPDEELRAAAIAVASTFEDPRLVPATITLLKDPDWWIRIAAAETLGRSKDVRAVEPLVAALADPDVKWAAVEALGHIADPRALSALGRMLGDPQANVRIEVMQALRNFNHPQVVQALTQMAKTDPERAVRMRAVDVLEEIARRDHTSGSVSAVRDEALAARSRQGEPRLHTYLISTRNAGASDFHLSVGQPPIIRVAADLVRAQGEPFTAAQTEAILREILSEQQWTALQSEQQIDFCHYIPQAGRYRANVFVDHRGYNAVFRVIPEKPPTISELGLPAHLAEIAGFHQGLVLVCGPSGSGKSTTLAALVNLFNETRSDHILTMEDPVEFVHPFKNCLINQREVGRHTRSFARALRAALREDPDVIVIGELRDNESVALALTAAETGHIVLGTLNSTSAPKAIDRLISSFPVDEQPQIRASLSESLRYVIAQRLLPAKEGRKQVACFEVLKGTGNIANMIRDEKTYQIHSAMQIGRSLGMQTFDEALRDLIKREQITPEAAYMAASKKEDFEPFVSPEFLKAAQ